MLTLSDRWRETWRQMELPPPPDEILRDVFSRYGEEHRKYHTVQHLQECFQKFDELRGEASQPGEIELALWFHDAIYHVQRQDNEERSAELASSCLDAAGCPDGPRRKVAALILATRDHQPFDHDSQIMLDVDLSILGAIPARFEEYEQQIRAEYQHVPDPIFRMAREEILAKFLERDAIFRTQTFLDRYEQQARANLHRALMKLRSAN